MLKSALHSRDWPTNVKVSMPQADVGWLLKSNTNHPPNKKYMQYILQVIVVLCKVLLQDYDILIKSMLKKGLKIPSLILLNQSKMCKMPLEFVIIPTYKV